MKSDWRTRDGISYYLDSEGNVATDTWIQNTYYVDAQGAMVKTAGWRRTERAASRKRMVLPGTDREGGEGYVEDHREFPLFL